MKGLTLGTLCGVLLALSLLAVHDARQKEREVRSEAAQREAAERHTRDSLKALLAEAILTQAPARVDTVRTVVERTRTLRDSVLLSLTDTVLVERFVYRTDSLREQCLRCAALLDTIRARYGDEKKATESYVSLLQGELREATRTRWYDRFGAGVGYGLTKVGSQLYAGPQLQFQLRVWPW